jgi:hypothetical protein
MKTLVDKEGNDSKNDKFIASDICHYAQYSIIRVIKNI